MHDLREEQVFLNVHAALMLAFHRNAGTGNFGQTVNINGFDAQCIFDLRG